MDPFSYKRSYLHGASPSTMAADICREKMEEKERTEKAVSGGTEEEEEAAAGSDGQSAAAVRSKRTRTHRREITRKK